MVEQDQLRAPYVHVVEGISISDLSAVYAFRDKVDARLMQTLRTRLDKKFDQVRPMYYRPDLNCWLHFSRSPRSALCVYLLPPLGRPLAEKYKLILLVTPILVNENESNFWRWELSMWADAVDEAVAAHDGVEFNTDVTLDTLVSDFLDSPKGPGEVPSRL